MTKLRHCDDYGSARFVNFSCYRRFTLLKEAMVIHIFLREVHNMRQATGIRVYGYVVMPDHVHLVLHPPAGIKLGFEIGKLKARSARGILSHWRSIGPPIPLQLNITRDNKLRTVFWQRRCYDHNCRNIKAVMKKIDYCHRNPVGAGLVAAPEEWEWSSARWYQGKRPVALEIDAI